MPIETKYTKAGDIHVAYQVVGHGPIDLVLLMGWVSHLEYGWEGPSLARFQNRLASFSRLILFDKRGTGLSDRVAKLPTLEERMDDLRAVLDAVGSERTALLGTSEGGPMCALFAATYPERTSALVMYGSYAARHPSPDYPWAPSPQERQQWLTFIEEHWGDDEVDLSTLAPSMLSDEHFMRWWTTYLRRSASPGAVVQLGQMNTAVDIRHILPTIRVPTLLLHRTGDKDAPVEGSRWMAERIPGAKYVELPGIDHLPFVDHDALVKEVQAFVTGVQPAPTGGEVLATVLVAARVAPAVLAADLGDQRWRELVNRQEALIAEEVRQQRGRICGWTGHSLLATFDGPTRALRCALAVVAAVGTLGIQMRVGLHTGECEVTENDISGAAVRVAARVLELAGPGEVIASNTVRDLVAGSGLDFQERQPPLNCADLGIYRIFRVRQSQPEVINEKTVSGGRRSVLTQRERDVAVLIARGFTNRQIADQLVISAGTVERHVANICNKLGYHSRAQISLWAGEHGLLAAQAD